MNNLVMLVSIRVRWVNNWVKWGYMKGKLDYKTAMSVNNSVRLANNQAKLDCNSEMLASN